MDLFNMDKAELEARVAEAFASAPPTRAPRAQALHLAATLPGRSGARDREGGPWTVNLEADGTVRAEAADGTLVLGWAAVPQAVDEVLAPFEASTFHRPIAQVPDNGSLFNARTKQAFPFPDDNDLGAAFDRDPQALAAVTAAVTDLRHRWNGAAVPELVEQAAARLRTQEPQIPALTLDESEQRWCNSVSCGWVRTEAIVNTGDPLWGRIHRSGYSRSSSWIPRAAAELLDQPPADLPAFLRHHLLDNEGPVDLITINGPEGPVYNLNSGGTHRTHLFRILGLPRLFATQSALTTPLQITHSIDFADRWQGLINHGLLTGAVDRGTYLATLSIRHSPAPWMLADPGTAAAYNAAYERAYPGALGRLGVPSNALSDHVAWEAWLLTPPLPSNASARGLKGLLGRLRRTGSGSARS
ncbi:hypothetical protein ACI1MP_37465 (plasmid) [Kitasatospora griseola]|uniref:hypothetical protein n=1 Tax=Kitasatospora griseola TaxID=2064 RepID=UPI003855A97F